METGVLTRRRKTTNLNEGDAEKSHGDLRCSPELMQTQDGVDSHEPTLWNILKEIREFRKDNNEQYSDIKNELKRVNERLSEAEERIDDTETVLQAASKLIKRLTERQANLEARLIDQEGRARRGNLRIYGIPEDKEGLDMVSFLDNLLKKALDIPGDQALGIERAHRALAAKPKNSTQAKPRSIVVSFGSYRTKEEVIRRAWQKKEVFCDTVRFFIDHDFPSEVLKRRNEYVEAKRVLKENHIKFQTPYPAKMRVFYNDGTRLYQSATEATRDMATRGLPVSVVKSPVASDQDEIRLLSTWRPVGERYARDSDLREEAPREEASQQGDAHARFREKLQGFRRQTLAQD